MERLGSGLQIQQSSVKIIAMKDKHFDSKFILRIFVFFIIINNNSGINRIRNIYNTIYTCSYDGSMKKFDLDQCTTDDVFIVDQKHRKSLAIHDFISVDSDSPLFYVAINDGY